jgi:hypothetical protein
MYIQYIKNSWETHNFLFCFFCSHWIYANIRKNWSLSIINLHCLKKGGIFFFVFWGEDFIKKNFLIKIWIVKYNLQEMRNYKIITWFRPTKIKFHTMLFHYLAWHLKTSRYNKSMKKSLVLLCTLFINNLIIYWYIW